MKKNGFFKIADYLNLRDVGVLEMAFAFTPMLGGLKLGALPLSVLMWGLLMVIAIFQGKLNKSRSFTALTLFVIYWLCQKVVAMLSGGINFNGLIAQLIYFAAIYVLYPTLDGRRMRGSLNWVAIISILGLLYQWSLLVRGNLVHPLEIPGLTMSESRIETESLRPSSFYMEPAAYVAFMICPLALSLIDKKYVWSVVLILSIFLTTSTTGIALSFILLAVSSLGQRFRMRSLIAALLIGGGMFYALTHFEMFELGVEKIENTDSETSVRLSQGPKVVKNMQTSEYIFGVPYDNAYDFCISRGVNNVVYYGESVFMPTFWDLLLLYGILGLLLYINIYISILRMNRIVLPFIICVVATWFSGGYGLQSGFPFSTIFLLVTARMYKTT